MIIFLIDQKAEKIYAFWSIKKWFQFLQKYFNKVKKNIFRKKKNNETQRNNNFENINDQFIEWFLWHAKLSRVILWQG